MGATTCTIGSSKYKNLKLKKKEEKRGPKALKYRKAITCVT